MTMTAKQQLLERVSALTEDEAADTLRLLDMRLDPVLEAFHSAAPDDEPWTSEDETSAVSGRTALAQGHTVSLDDAMRDLG
jgi:hypothetical protein